MRPKMNLFATAVALLVASACGSNDVAEIEPIGVEAQAPPGFDADSIELWASRDEAFRPLNLDPARLAEYEAVAGVDLKHRVLTVTGASDYELLAVRFDGVGIIGVEPVDENGVATLTGLQPTEGSYELLGWQGQLLKVDEQVLFEGELPAEVDTDLVFSLSTLEIRSATP